VDGEGYTQINRGEDNCVLEAELWHVWYRNCRFGIVTVAIRTYLYGLALTYLQGNLGHLGTSLIRAAGYFPVFNSDGRLVTIFSQSAVQKITWQLWERWFTTRMTTTEKISAAAKILSALSTHDGCFCGYL
jgi:hypothetical protein